MGLRGRRVQHEAFATKGRGGDDARMVGMSSGTERGGDKAFGSDIADATIDSFLVCRVPDGSERVGSRSGGGGRTVASARGGSGGLPNSVATLVARYEHSSSRARANRRGVKKNRKQAQPGLQVAKISGLQVADSMRTPSATMPFGLMRGASVCSLSGLDPCRDAEGVNVGFGEVGCCDAAARRGDEDGSEGGGGSADRSADCDGECGGDATELGGHGGKEDFGSGPDECCSEVGGGDGCVNVLYGEPEGSQSGRARVGACGSASGGMGCVGPSHCDQTAQTTVSMSTHALCECLGSVAPGALA